MRILFDHGTPSGIARSLAGHEVAWEQIAHHWDDIRRKSQPAISGLTPERVRDVFLAVLVGIDDAALRAELQDRFVEALASA